MWSGLPFILHELVEGRWCGLAHSSFPAKPLGLHGLFGGMPPFLQVVEGSGS